MIPILIVNCLAVSAVSSMCMLSSICFILDCISYLEMSPLLRRDFNQAMISSIRCYDIVSRTGYPASSPMFISVRPSNSLKFNSPFTLWMPYLATYAKIIKIVVRIEYKIAWIKIYSERLDLRWGRVQSNCLDQRLNFQYILANTLVCFKLRVQRPLLDYRL